MSMTMYEEDFQFAIENTCVTVNQLIESLQVWSNNNGGSCKVIIEDDNGPLAIGSIVFQPHNNVVRINVLE